MVTGSAYTKAFNHSGKQVTINGDPTDVLRKFCVIALANSPPAAG